MNQDNFRVTSISRRFRSFLPVVIDIETAGFDAERHAILEIAAVPIMMNENGTLMPGATTGCHVQPFPGAELDQRSLDFNGIDPFHPFRMAKPEKEALEAIFFPVRSLLKAHRCTRAILVAHNPLFDMAFLKAAVERCKIKNFPFHAFSSFDTATLGGLAYGQTVLARAVQAAGMSWEAKEAHSAIYDAEKTSQLFCKIVNEWDTKVGLPLSAFNPERESEESE